MPKREYQAPVVRLVGSLDELTLLVPKNTNNHPDGFSLNGTILTS
jgi:hypothetical protein